MVIPHPGTAAQAVQAHVDSMSQAVGVPQVSLHEMIGASIGDPGLASLDLSEPVIVLLRAGATPIEEPRMTLIATAVDPTPLMTWAINEGGASAVDGSVVQVGNGVTGFEDANSASYQAIASARSSEPAAMAFGGIEISNLYTEYGEMARGEASLVFAQMAQMQQMFAQSGMQELGEMMQYMAQVGIVGGLHIWSESDRAYMQLTIDETGGEFDMRFQPRPGTALQVAMAGDPSGTPTDGAVDVVGHQPGSIRMAGMYNGHKMADLVDAIVAAINVDPLSPSTLPLTMTTPFSDALRTVNGSMGSVMYAGQMAFPIKTLWLKSVTW